MIERLNCTAEVSHLAMYSSRDRMIDMVRVSLTNKIARQIAMMKTTEQRGEFHTTFGCNVIVADPEDYWKAVHEEARRLSVGYSPMPVWTDESAPITKDQWDNACAGLGTKA